MKIDADGGYGAAVGSVEELRLRDGRRLAYAIYGDPDGFPVLNCHGGLACHLDVEPAAGAARELGARLVSPDRPGIGGSDRRPAHSTLGWADDAGELLEALGIERFACMGWSLGGQYAAAAAYCFEDRVTRAAIIAGCPPLDDPERFAELNWIDRTLARLSVHAKPLARASFSAMRGLARHAPDRLARVSARGASPSDRAALIDHGDWSARALTGGLTDPRGMVDEYRAFVAPWGFRPEDVTVPVDLWQGTADRLVPVAWAEILAERIPSAKLRILDGEGHMIGLTRRADVIRALLEPRSEG